MPVVTADPWSRVLRHPWFQDNDEATLFEFEGVVKYVPLILGGGLFAFTILVAALGPIDWRFDNAAKVYGFLLACLLALAAGYVLSVRKRPRVARLTPATTIPASLLVVGGRRASDLLLYPLTVHEATGTWYPDVYARASWRTPAGPTPPRPMRRST